MLVFRSAISQHLKGLQLETEHKASCSFCPSVGIGEPCTAPSPLTSAEFGLSLGLQVCRKYLFSGLNCMTMATSGIWSPRVSAQALLPGPNHLRADYGISRWGVLFVILSLLKMSARHGTRKQSGRGSPMYQGVAEASATLFILLNQS